MLPIPSSPPSTSADPRRISFKRRQKPPSGFSLFPFGSPSSSTPHLAPPEPSYLISPNDDDLELSQRPNRHVDTLSDAELEESWSSEIAGKRFYDDLTAIDWIFEYTKERLRLKALAGRTGIGGYAATAIDSSQVWVVLILTGVAAGLLAATIDIIANWLGDLKDGYCRSHFYLSRNFCCWGLDGEFPRLLGCTTNEDSGRHLQGLGMVERSAKGVGLEGRVVCSRVCILHYVFCAFSVLQAVRY